MLLLQFAHHFVEIVVQLEPAREKEMLARWNLRLAYPFSTFFQTALPNKTFPPLIIKLLFISLAGSCPTTPSSRLPSEVLLLPSDWQLLRLGP